MLSENFYFITGTNGMAPPEIQAVMKFANAEVVGQKNGIIVWRLRRKASAASDDETTVEPDDSESAPPAE